MLATSSRKRIAFAGGSGAAQRSAWNTRLRTVLK